MGTDSPDRGPQLPDEDAAIPSGGSSWQADAPPDTTEFYDSAHRRSAPVEELTELLRFRDLVAQLVRRDVVARYKRSALGVAWTMLNPLGTMVILSLVFAQLFEARAFPAYVLSGLLVWTFFAQSTTAAMAQLVHGRSLLHHIYMPRTVFAVSAVGTGLVNLLLALVPLAVIVLVVGPGFRPAVVLMPLAILLLALFVLGVALLLSVLAAYFPDVAEMYQIALLGWMYLTPIFYPEEIIPDAYRWWLLNLNPMYHLITLFRLPIYYGQWPSLSQLAVAAGVSGVVVAAGWLAFTSRADELAYRV